MKKLILYTLLPIVASILNLSKATSEVIPLPVLNRVYITPDNPTPTDSVTIAFDYVSGDSCPDYYLVKDSVVANKIYVSKKSIDNSMVMCAQIVTKFTTTLNLGMLEENTQIYFEGVLIKTISYSQVIPPVQDSVYITPGNPGSTDSVTVAYVYVSDDSCPDYYLVKDSVVANKIYVSKKNSIVNTRVICAQIVTKFTTTLNLGMLEDNTQIYFEGVLIKTISYPCTMDKNGVIVAGTGGCTGHLFIEERTIASPAIPRLYALPNTTVINGNGTQPGLIPGEIVKFGGYELLTDSYAKNPCPVFGIATCYEVISTPPACVMDKKGVVVAGTDGCTGRIFIQDTSSPNTNPQLYALRDSATVNGNNTVALKPGDIVMFGDSLTINVTGLTGLCHTVGVVTCYQVISTPPACVMDKSGMVVAGTNACTGQLFIEETTPYMSMIPRLYSFKNDTVINANSLTALKVGDQVKFGGYLTPNDSSVMNLCHTIGVATCYELVQPENVDTLMGTVYAGNAIAKTGLAILYKKGDSKATATYTITNGTFLFTNLSNADYTVYIIPDINAYRNYLPTFYKNNFLFQNADYITLAGTMMNVTVNLKSYVYPVGTGKIYGNIFFETYTLKDSLLVDSVQYKTGSIVVNNSAINTPVLLLNRIGEPVAWTLTDLYGNYTFENIALDTYTILSETASAEGDSNVSLSPANSIANADLILKGLQSYTGITNPEDVVQSIYPNPVSDNLIIVLKEAENVGIYNTLGQLLINKRLNQGINVLDLSTMNKSIYFVRIGETTIKLIKK